MPDSPSSNSRLHRWIAVAALLWNLLGLMAFVMQVSMTPEQVAALPAADRAVRDAMPGGITAAFGVAVGGGVLGSVGLLLRKRWAVAAFTASLLALMVQIVGGYLLTPLWQATGAAGAVLPALLLAIGVALLGYARRLTT